MRRCELHRQRDGVARQVLEPRRLKAYRLASQATIRNMLRFGMRHSRMHNICTSKSCSLGVLRRLISSSDSSSCSSSQLTCDIISLHCLPLLMRPIMMYAGGHLAQMNWCKQALSLEKYLQMSLVDNGNPQVVKSQQKLPHQCFAIISSLR